MLQFGASLTQDTSIVIYDHIMFTIQATECALSVRLLVSPTNIRLGGKSLTVKSTLSYRDIELITTVKKLGVTCPR